MTSSSKIIDLLRAASGEAGVLDYAAFTEIALYDPACGYYRKNRRRVGKTRGTDFYTASSHGAIFGKLVRAAAVNLFGAEFCRECALVEIGAEPGQALFAGEKEFFKEIVTVRVGEPVVLPEKAVVFSNELLDAFPFSRFIFKAGAWRELGVNVAGENLFECLLDGFSGEDARAFAGGLQAPLRDGHVVDVSLRAENFLRNLAGGNWRGGLIFFDYGKTLRECLEVFPEGTARAYCGHRQHNDLLAVPGEQDLTCHVLWDRAEEILAKAGFRSVRTERQEAFFMRRSADAVAAIMASPDTGCENERSRLRELLHPAHFGHKFQVLSAARGPL